MKAESRSMKIRNYWLKKDVDLENGSVDEVREVARTGYSSNTWLTMALGCLLASYVVIQGLVNVVLIITDHPTLGNSKDHNWLFISVVFILAAQLGQQRRRADALLELLDRQKQK